MPRSWTQLEWERVLVELQTDGSVDASGIHLSSEDVQRLVDVTRKGDDGRPEFSRANFDGTHFGDGANFFRAVFGPLAYFRGAIFTGIVDFDDAIFGDGAVFDGARFSGVRASFQRAQFGDDASFNGAQFEGVALFSVARFGCQAFFGRAIFGDWAVFEEVRFAEGAFFRETTFAQGADFTEARLEGAVFAGTSLAGSILNRTMFDYRTSFDHARLFTHSHGGRPPVHRTRLADVRWNGASVVDIADWGERQPRVGEDPYPAWPRSLHVVLASWLGWLAKRVPLQWARTTAGSDAPAMEGNAMSALALAHYSPRLAAVPEALRTYRQLTTLLREQGMTEIARRFDYRHSQLARRAPPKKGDWPEKLRWIPWVRWGLTRALSRLVDLTSLYGYSPVRVMATYASTVLTFAAIYRICGVTGWSDAIPFSLIAFHGRGVISGNIQADSSLLWIPAIEAALGLLIEALLVATIIRRLFRE